MTAAERPSSLSVFFPAYNDGGAIASLVIQAVKAAGRLTPDYVIVVNDGSADWTAEVLEELCAIYPRLRVVHHERNRGYGGALQSGFGAATKVVVPDSLGYVHARSSRSVVRPPAS
jgi:glycosyltransferase involved in cell wall biosynthesis